MTTWLDGTNSSRPTSTLELVFNVKTYGAVGDGTTDDVVSIQAALTAAGVVGGTVFFPRGIYIVGSTLRVSALTEVVGDNVVGAVGTLYGASILKMKNGANLDAVVAHDGWYNNLTTGLGPLGIRNLNIDGNKANQTSGLGYGFVSSGWRTSVMNCTIANARGDGIRLTSVTRNGSTEVSGNIGEPRIENCVIDTPTGSGIAIIEGASKSKVTDGFIIDCTIRNSGIEGINLTQGAGWLVDGNHVYGTGAEGIFVDRAYATKVINNYCEYVGSTPAWGYVPGILVRAVWDCIIANNTCFIYESWIGAGDIPVGIFAQNFSAGPGYFTINGNIVYNIGWTQGTVNIVLNNGAGDVRLSMPPAANQIINWPEPVYVDSATVGNAQTVPYAATVTPSPLNGETLLIGTLTGPITVTNVATGHAYQGTCMTLKFTQDATGGRIVSWGTTYKVNWTPTTTTGKVNTITFVFDGTNWNQIATGIGL